MRDFLSQIIRVVPLIFLFIVAHTLVAQVDTSSVVTQDTLGVTQIDTTRHYLVPIPNVGSLDPSLAPEQTLADSNMNFNDYRYIGDLLATFPGVYIRELGSPGQLHGLTINGLDARNIAFFQDGILLNDPLTGVFDPNLISTESIERIEVIAGPRAFLYGLNSTGGAINFITKTKKAIHPYSRIRYSESAHDYGYFDGMFSQDIIRGLNVTAGAQHVTSGGRFKNSDDDSWNTRIKLRYNISNKVNLFASEMYNKTQVGLNGGVDTTKTSFENRFDGRQATVVNSDSYEKVTRHDMQLGSAFRLFNDTSAVTTMTLYLSSSLREYRDEENRKTTNGIFVQQDHHTQWYGGKLTQHFVFGPHFADFSGEVQRRGVIASDVTEQRLRTLTSISALTGIRSNAITTSFYIRFDSYFEERSYSLGMDFTAVPSRWLEIYFGGSRSYRFPTFQEENFYAYPFSPELKPEPHDTYEISARIISDHLQVFELKFFSCSIGSNQYLRNTPGNASPLPTSYTNFDTRPMGKGFAIKASYRLNSFFVDGTLLYHDGFPWYEVTPKWTTTGGFYFWDKLVDGHLDLKTGFRGKAFSHLRAIGYDPQTQLYFPITSGETEAAGTLDYVLIAHIGSAYVHFIWENLFDREYVTTSFYPMPDRAIRFGVTWEFTD